MAALPTEAQMRRRLAAFERREAVGGRRAAVALTVLEHRATPSVLLVKRVARGRNAGQWALPGGKLEPGEDAVAGALRELAEETGIAAAREHVAGRLDDLVTASGFVIAPVVVLAPAGERPQRQAEEIASLHPIALERLLAPGVPRWARTPQGEPLLQMPLRHDMVVHAPTGAILLQFAEVVLRGRELRVGELAQPEWTRS